MESLFSLALLMLYSISIYSIGAYLMRIWFKDLPVVFFFTASFLSGIGIGIPITYVLACLLTWTGASIVWGMITMTVFSFWFLVPRWKALHQKLGTRNDKPEITMSDIALVFCAILFSTWLMTKTFHGGVSGEIFTGSNNVFDFGHAVGLLRSFSWGANIPFTSPFEAGLPFFYHFFFLFWVGLLEHCGIPLVWALNIPSIVSFSALLIVVYFFPRIVWKQGSITGWLAVLLVITHSTMTFWQLLLQKGLNTDFLLGLWRLPTYPFAGPFDGSMISIFMTLNNYVNQRHLAFSIAAALAAYLLFLKREETRKKIPFFDSVGIAIAAGILWYWNMAMSVSLMGMVILYTLLRKEMKSIASMIVVYAVCMFFILFPFIQVWMTGFTFFRAAAAMQSAGLASGVWNPVLYLWNNLGILPFIAFFGVCIVRKYWKQVTPLVVFFIFVCCAAVYQHRGFDQKFLSFAIIGVDMLAAVGLGWMWQKGIFVKGITFILVGILTISGVVDLLAVKNEFAFPLISKDTIPVISWMRKETPKNAVFVSYADIIDPVVLAGRKNYFGFFGNIGFTDRSNTVQNVYAGDVKTAKTLGISYILVPTGKKNDFPYMVDTMYFQEHHMLVYDDGKFAVFQVTSSK